MIPEQDISDRERMIRRDVEEIHNWWTKLTAQDADLTAEKAVRYGAADLEIMGAAMQSLLPIEGADDGEAATIGRYAACSFYALGKVARQFGALQQGRLPSEDTDFDLGVYAMMQRRIRQTGRWV